MTKTAFANPTSAKNQVFALELAEIARQEARADTRAGQLTTLAGILTTLAIAGVGGLVIVSPVLGGWILLPTLPLIAAICLWGWGVIVLLRDILRPHMSPGTVRGSFVDENRLEYLSTTPVQTYQQDHIVGLGQILVRRYQRIRYVIHLLIAGFICAGLALGSAIIAYLYKLL